MKEFDKDYVLPGEGKMKLTGYVKDDTFTGNMTIVGKGGRDQMFVRDVKIQGIPDSIPAEYALEITSRLIEKRELNLTPR